MKTQNLLSMAVIGLMLVFASCDQGEKRGNSPDADSPAMSSDSNMRANGTSYENDDQDNMDKNMAIATIHGTKGNDLKGTISFKGGDDGVKIHADVSGLPQGKHGFHIHLYGDCSKDDGTSAGTHYNFEGSSKNPPSDIDRITGNLGEINAQGSGSATADTTIDNTSLDDIMGRAVIIHAKGNDTSQPPIGAAGARLGCGVIGHANPESMMMNDQMNHDKMENDKMDQ